MTSNNLQSKLPMTIGAVLIIVAIGYYFYTQGGNQASTGDQTLSFEVSTGSSSALIGTDVLALLKKIHQLKIDYKFFESDGEQSLYDFSKIIPPENVGRPNPFLPIGNAGINQQGGIMSTLAASSSATSTSSKSTKKK